MKFKNCFLFVFLFIFGCSSPESESPNPKTETKSSNNDYYENGNIRIERKRLENGDSLWIFKQEDGGCWEEDFYRDGEIYKKIVFNSDCTKSAEYELKDGKRHGKWKSYFENGEVKEYGKYKEGLPEKMIYHDETGKMMHPHIYQRKDSLSFPLFQVENNFTSIKNMLSKNGIRFTIDEDIKVAGDNEYHFPELRWEGNELQFDMKEGNKIIRCRSGKITEPKLTFFNGITIGMDLVKTCYNLGTAYSRETTNVFIFDLKEKMTYRFEFENKKLIAIYFEGTTEAY